jgi:aspartate racemase
MGPAATADFMQKLVAATPAERESDYTPIVVWSNPGIPDRTRALLGLGPSPVPAMLDGIVRLRGAGADVIAIPCNTAHAYLPALQAAIDVEILNMVELATAEAAAFRPDVRRVGILSTAGTRLTGLYASACRARDVIPLELDADQQAQLSDRAIALVKTGRDLPRAERLILEAATLLRDRGAEVVIAGCTEIPLVSGRADAIVPVIDATACLAKAAIGRVRHGTAGGARSTERVQLSTLKEGVL